jgi:ubiquinone/menaquinone biosynthesis C-methylase UbiE
VSDRPIDSEFVGSIAEMYERYLVPLIFDPYASEMAQRVARLAPKDVLEIAAGTGVVTRALARHLPANVHIVATDLNQPMIDHAAQIGTTRAVEWRQADAMQLPFPDASFDVVVCQFGVMFFPDKPRAFAEAQRVLRPGGAFIFSVWDRIEENEMVCVVANELKAMFPENPPLFMERTPHGYHDRAAILRDLFAGGFTTPPTIDTVAKRSRAPSALEPALAYCQANPWKHEIDANNSSKPSRATARCAEALAARFGSGPIEGKIQAHIVSVRRNSRD